MTLRKTLLLIQIMGLFNLSSLFSAEPGDHEGNVSNSDVYLIHPGDKLNIRVFREKELSGVFVVSPSKKIDYPLLGEIDLDGLSVDELKKFLADKLGQDYLVNPQVQIDFEESQNTNRSITILGQVNKPGNYVYTQGITLVKMISEAGGFTGLAAPNRVKIVRSSAQGKTETIHVNANEILDGNTKDAALEQGDLVVVSESFF